MVRCDVLHQPALVLTDHRRSPQSETRFLRRERRREQQNKQPQARHTRHPITLPRGSERCLRARYNCAGDTMRNVRWGWILLGGFLAELAIFVVVIPLSLLFGPESLLYSAPPASFLAVFVFAIWVARKAPSRPVLHGALVGVVSMLIYLGISLGRPEPLAYVIAHGLKVLGGVAGGLVAF